MTALLTAFWPYIAAAGAALIGALGLYAKGRSDAKAKAAAQRAADELKARDIADQAKRDASAMTPEQRRDELRRWSR